MPEALRAFIVRELEADTRDVILVEGMLGLSALSALVNEERPDLKFARFEPRFPERIRDFGGDSFAAIRAKGEEKGLLLPEHPATPEELIALLLRPGFSTATTAHSGFRARRRHGCRQ